MERSVFAVIGGDSRQIALANILASEGITVYCSGFEHSKGQLIGTASTDPLTAAHLADAVILPMPPTRDGKTLHAPLSTYRVSLDGEFCEALRGKSVFVGMAEKLREVSPSYSSLDLFDFSASEVFLQRNAEATAEGALAGIISDYPRTVCGSKVLLAGYGRITGFLAPMLRAVGARCSVAARKPADRAKAASYGMEALTFSAAKSRAKDFDIIVNTVPAMVIDEKFIDRLSPDTALFELASAPGGIDAEACRARNILFVPLPGLPGKYSPLTAAEIIKDTVMYILEEGQ